MATFKNVVVADDAKKAEVLGQSASGFIGTSPFIDGAQITITGYELVNVAIDGTIPENSPFRLVFRSTVGDIALTMLFKNKVDANGNIVKPTGSFNEFVAGLIKANPAITLKELADKVLTTHPRIVVKRDEYPAKTKDGRDYVAATVGFDIVVA